MESNNTLIMTKGNTLKLIISFSIPMLIGNLFQQLYNLVDSVVVGKLVGADALAAVGATGSVSFLFFALYNGIVWFISGLTAWMRYLKFRKNLVLTDE